MATASPATPLAGSREAGSSHGRGWRAHGRRREEWAGLPPGEKPGRGRRRQVEEVEVAAAAMAAMTAAAVAVVAVMVAVVAVERQRRPRGGREDRRRRNPFAASAESLRGECRIPSRRVHGVPPGAQSLSFSTSNLCVERAPV